jgi:hypothetical protein
MLYVCGKQRQLFTFCDSWTYRAVGDRWVQVEEWNWNNVLDAENVLVDNDPRIQTNFGLGLLKCPFVIGQ